MQKTNQILIFMALIIAGLYYGAPLLIPFTFGIFFATLIFPAVRWFENKTGVGKMTSSFLGTLVIFIGIGLLLFFFIQQLGFLLEDLIASKEEILKYFEKIQQRVVSMTGIGPQEQQQVFRDNIGNILGSLQNYIAGVLVNILGVLLEFLLVLIYVFLLLLNRDKFLEFLKMYTPSEKHEENREIIGETRKVAHKYLWGRIQVMAILSLLYLVTFTAYDLRHTGLLVLFGAIITIIPYIGPFISGLVPVLFMIVFADSSAQILSFAIIITIIQLIESYVLEPLLIGAEVEQSPLFIIIAIILGGLLWGPAGLILFVPLFGILKILFDHTSRLKPVGFLIGYDRPGSGEGIFEKLKKKLKK